VSGRSCIQANNNAVERARMVGGIDCTISAKKNATTPILNTVPKFECSGGFKGHICFPNVFSLLVRTADFGREFLISSF
jgi:hypothetical protein